MSEIQQQVTTAEVDFTFRKNAEGFKRDTVSLAIPVPTNEAIAAFLAIEGESKTRDMIADAVQSLVTTYVRGKVDADENFSQETLDQLVAAGEVSVEYIANLPRSTRSTVSKDELEALAKAYAEIMPQVSDTSKKAAEAGGQLFVNRFKSIIGNDGALRKMQARLTEFLEKAPDEVASNNANAITYLLGRLEEALGINYDADAL